MKDYIAGNKTLCDYLHELLNQPEKSGLTRREKMSKTLETLAQLAETHLQSPGDFYRTIDMMRHEVKSSILIKRSMELKRKS